jgi:hypothetical protein
MKIRTFLFYLEVALIGGVMLLGLVSCVAGWLR